MVGQVVEQTSITIVGIAACAPNGDGLAGQHIAAALDGNRAATAHGQRYARFAARGGNGIFTPHWTFNSRLPGITLARLGRSQSNRRYWCWCQGGLRRTGRHRCICRLGRMGGRGGWWGGRPYLLLKLWEWGVDNGADRLDRFHPLPAGVIGKGGRACVSFADAGEPVFDVEDLGVTAGAINTLGHVAVVVVAEVWAANALDGMRQSLGWLVVTIIAVPTAKATIVTAAGIIDQVA
jgi:hypothetical protein